MILPTEPTEPLAFNPRLLVLYGQPKIGKTTLCANLPGKYCILEADRGGNGADYIKCVRIPIKSYDDLITTCAEITKAGRPYKYLVLDSISEYIDHCETDATRTYKSSSQGKKFDGRSVLELLSGEFSPGYEWLRKSMDLAMQKLIDAAPYIIVIAHLRDKLLRSSNDDKGKVDTFAASKELDLYGKCRAKLVLKADVTGFIYRTADGKGDQKIWVDFRTTELVNLGSRCEHLIQKNFEFDWNKIYLPDKV